MKSFNTPVIEETPLEFEIDGDKFVAIPSGRLPGGVLDSYFKSVNNGDIFEAHHDFFKVVLDSASYDLFEERFNSIEKPITLQMLGEVASWLLGDYYMGNGVTEQDQPSTIGPAPKKTGRSSTAGVVRKG